MPQLALASVALAASACASAADISPHELAQLRAEARRTGAVPVLVHLQPSTLAQLRTGAAELRRAADAKSSRLLAELGLGALRGGRWSNGAGQIGLYVTESGLDVLAGTANAIFFARGADWKNRTALNGLDGSHAAIEEALQRQGYVDLEVLANADGLEAEHGADGKARFSATPGAARAAGTRLAALLESARDEDFEGRPGLARAAAAMSASPLLTMRVTREGLLKLADSDAVRNLRPLGHTDTRPVDIDPAALEHAMRHGEADVIVVMRDAYAGGKLTPNSVAAMKRSNRAALDALLAHARPGAVKQDFSRFGAVAARLDAAELATLANRKDPRLLAVMLNRPLATTQLAQSAPLLNMPAAWNARLYAEGQNIIVMDTGVDASHPFFGGRVVFQACFGTTGLVNNVNWASPCPGASASTNWDSPWGTPNAAAPAFGDSHGTHVAGIAAGVRTSPSVLQGTASGASIFAVQASSKNTSNNKPSFLTVDVLAAFQLAADALAPLTNGNAQPFTINMSFGGGTPYSSACAGVGAPLATAVLQLRNAGVPAIAATANDGFTNAIGWPACVPGVIKVSSVVNDGIGTTRSIFSNGAANVVDPAAFPGETFWLAPGGGNGTTVISATTAGGYIGKSGTSMATPQVTGLYATAKAAMPTLGVSEITAWFQANAAVIVPITVTVDGTQKQVNWRRIRLPAL